VTAAVISPAKGQRSARRSRFGSQRRAAPVRTISWVQASSSQARAAISHHKLVLGEALQRQVPQPGALSVPDSVLAPGPAAVLELQVGELPAPGVSGEGGEPVAVGVGEPRLRPGVGGVPQWTMACIPAGQEERSSSPVMPAPSLNGW
jgi:hypothetical protein